MSGLVRFAVVLTFIYSATLRLPAAESNDGGRNSDPVYQQLRSLTLGTEAVSVSNIDLRRDAATFHLRSGTLCFLTPVQGKVTGAIFTGDGNFVLSPPTASERSMLKLLTKEDEFSESFNNMVLRFTDSSYDEIKKAGTAAPVSCDGGLLKDSQDATRHERELKFNLESRILEDVLSPEPGGLFVAFVHGKRYSNRELFTIDPHASGDEVELTTYSENKYGRWAGFNLADHREHRARIHIEHQQLDTRIEKSGNLTGKAATTIVARNNGLRVVPLDLFPSLRVISVTGDGGVPLSFIQEGKNEDSDFAVVLPKTLAAGEKYTITTSYAGKEAVLNEGGGNYFPVAREDWFPNNPNGALGEYTDYEMTFRVPKGMKMAATGDLVSESNDGGESVTVWKSGPQTVAGFNFGKFKVEEAKLTKPEYLVQSFANEQSPDWVSSLQRAAEGPALGTEGSSHMSNFALGTMSTTGLNKKALAEGEVALQLYTDYFGPSSYKRLALTQQTACTFGQSWPQLVWIPICYYFDTTVRHQLGLRDDKAYWKVVTPHEVAHQWWGHTVGFNSYRDQWMSEGFADFSASLYLQAVYSKEPNRYFDFWKEERELLIDRNAEGFRAIDAGPLTLGYRLNTTRTGSIARRLIYPKGAYVLHMIQMLMWSRKTGDQGFRDMMQDFVKTYSNKAATTEEFKAMVEKHMTPDMDLENNHRMDWFFNEYVYGTALPSYKLEYATFNKDANGDVVFAFKVTQSGVDEKFRMAVPIYVELAEGRTVMLGRASLTGNSSAEQRVPLKGLKDVPRRAVLNYNYDVLAGN